jgi:hypothetical protein
MFAAIAEELGVVVGAMIDSPAAVAPGAPAMGRQWAAEVHAEGALTGTITIVLDHGGAAAITALVTGVEGPDEALADTVRELLAQAVAATALKPVARSAELSVREVVSSESRVPIGEWAAYAITAEKLPVALVITTYGSFGVAQAGGVKTTTAAALLRRRQSRRQNRRSTTASTSFSTSISRWSCGSGEPSFHCGR